ncbi:SRR1-like protein isoform X1 [Cydia fagiglandana]|uniref:SRR1-like protein isoform X1 n=1 Tax=Cydia fagiglandana TaxID=1458189 RepID=UPI002FEDE8E9
MSKQQVDSDGFQIVSSKRFSKNKQTKIPSRESKFEEQEAIIDVDKAIKRIQSAADDLRASDYWKHVLESVSTVLSSRKLKTIVCFGLGHIGECNISRYQLALLLCLKDSLNCSDVLVHDPVFYKSECTILDNLELQVIAENTEGGYVISKHDPTLLYLPHCPKQLTNNFLWSNWGPELENCILICNSFSSLVENLPNRILKETVPFIAKISPFVSEIILENNFVYTDIFNDTSIHHFPSINIEKLDKDFWIKGDKPNYENTEEFITSLMVGKLNI